MFTNIFIPYITNINLFPQSGRSSDFFLKVSLVIIIFSVCPLVFFKISVIEIDMNLSSAKSQLLEYA